MLSQMEGITDIHDIFTEKTKLSVYSLKNIGDSSSR